MWDESAGVSVGFALAMSANAMCFGRSCEDTIEILFGVCEKLVYNRGSAECRRYVDWFM